MIVKLANADSQIEACFDVMSELRLYLKRDEFVTQVRRQEKQGYQLVFVEDTGEVVCVAGFRIGNSLSWGKFLYVDDLVAAEACRSMGYGEAMLDWLKAYAKEQGCQQLHLDSGVQRFAAHRFYLKQRMDITCHHFAVEL
jgi:GNAT superfamily N-acetyltransferase